MQDRGGTGHDPTLERAFRQLFDDQLGDLWRFARRRCPTDQDADDVAAEVFAVAWRRRGDLPSGPDLRAWLFGVARNVLANQRRSAGRRRRLHLRLTESEATRPASAPPADEVASVGSGALATALAHLAEADREVLLLRAWDGLAVTEIAALLGCTPNAASVRLHKARGRLAAALESVVDTPVDGDIDEDADHRRTDRPAGRTGGGRSPRTRGGAR